MEVVAIADVVRQLNKTQQELVLSCVRLAHKAANAFSKSESFDRDDLFGEACLALCKAALHWQENREASFLTYAYHCVFRHLNQLVQRANLPSKKAPPKVQYQTELVPDRFCSLQLYENREEKERLKKLTEELPPLQRRALVLHYFEGQTMEAIAPILGLTRPQVGEIIRRGRQNLKVELANTHSAGGKHA